ncbi:hypothetical protein Agabi119p4_7760 [Agaricus bisporus var. burnettii]|uniref:Uncharacterized protein n=1 Tax=Agaricus bisporus var. burnettii TaxID=192524 RepID=A0A8H7EZK0_AGABI|nr:hypothetical protein Agabi119p4_7760 [Agaricus bisporus var. burnettii]
MSIPSNGSRELTRFRIYFYLFSFHLDCIISLGYVVFSAIVCGGEGCSSVQALVACYRWSPVSTLVHDCRRLLDIGLSGTIA